MNGQTKPAAAPLSTGAAARRRLLRLTLGELRFLGRYGILALYALLTAIYLLLLYWAAPAARPAAGGVTILTDPAAMGLFFMGAVVLLEKSQRANCALAVSPVRTGEYIAAKALALLAVGLPVGVVVGVAAGNPIAGVLLSLLLSSPLFTFLGMSLACASGSLNQFLLLSVPVELVAFVPAMFYWFGGLVSPLWLLTPGVAAIALLSPDTSRWLMAALSLLMWNAAAGLACHRVVRAYFEKLGGGKL